MLAVIGLGSNLGNGQENLRLAWHKLGQVSDIDLGRLSSPYRTEPLGMESEHWFTNAVGSIETTLAPKVLLKVLLSVEQEMGRDRSKGQDRPIDLDLLYYGEDKIDEPDLIVPHPEIANRLFVLEPMCEIEPNLMHPQLHLTSVQMLDRLTSEEIVQREDWQEEKL